MARKERRFTFKSGKSSKFWNIRVDGASLRVRFGRIGTEGQEKTKKFDDALAAERAAEKLVREKTAKGYEAVKGRGANAEAKKARVDVPRKSQERGSGKRSDHPSSGVKPKVTSKKATWGPGNPDYERHVGKYGRPYDEAKARDLAMRQRFNTLPSRIRRKLSWDELESEIREKIPKEAVNRRLPKSVPGLTALPPSYVEFISRFEDTYEWRLVYQKRTWPVFFNLERRMQQSLASLRSTYKTEAPRKAARIRELIPFASDASETSFCWDSAAIDKRGEPPIYAADFKPPYGLRRLGADLLDVIQHYRPTSFVE